MRVWASAHDDRRTCDERGRGTGDGGGEGGGRSEAVNAHVLSIAIRRHFNPDGASVTQSALWPLRAVRGPANPATLNHHSALADANECIFCQ